MRLDQNGPAVNSVIEVNPDALAIAKEADEQRRQGHVKGPLHGIPVLLKDNIGTGDSMQTTAGSFALAGQPALKDSTVAAKLRAGGAVILGKMLGVPVGISFIGTAFSEPTLIKFAAGFEAQTHARVVPTFAPSLPVDSFERNTAAPERRAPDSDLSERDEGREVHHL
jgi:Asp-tRNA(Asn)/Glu-tRNA(Gln) amidotransferase A subunit family amidase